MTVTIDNAESAFLTGYSKWQDFREQFERQWLQPLAERQLGMMVKTLPANVAQYMDPATLEQIKQMMGG